MIVVCAQYATPRLDGITNKTTRTSVELRVALCVFRPKNERRQTEWTKEEEIKVLNSVCYICSVDCLAKYVFAWSFSLTLSLSIPLIRFF